MLTKKKTAPIFSLYDTVFFLLLFKNFHNLLKSDVPSALIEYKIILTITSQFSDSYEMCK